MLSARILAHRGLVDSYAAPNSLQAYEAAWSLGFGIELDIRDQQGSIVVAHDPPTKEASLLSLSDVLNLHRSRCPESYLALNIKSCGLAPMLKELVERFDVHNYFVFDMAVPDTRTYRELQLDYFVRLSDEEREPCFASDAAGYWVDQLQREWLTREKIKGLLAENRAVCVVSNELHNRSHEPLWRELALPFSNDPRFFICTDYPEAFLRAATL